MIELAVRDATRPEAVDYFRREYDYGYMFIQLVADCDPDTGWITLLLTYQNRS